MSFPAQFKSQKLRLTAEAMADSQYQSQTKTQASQDGAGPTSAAAAAATDKVVVEREELHAFCVRSMVKVGAAPSHACALADLLVAADYRGHFSHGLNRLGLCFLLIIVIVV